ncbi:MAG: hypothetical protein MUF84_18490 [Anaerolineae bacterium]|jgi:hypothetical protein|nr:hypothetical protein [Anaerolineae bacterium]
MRELDSHDKLYVVWAFAFQIVLIAHFAVRQRFFEGWTLRYGWIVYALAIPAAAISLVLLRGGKPWWSWLGGFIFLPYAAFGYWVDYVIGIGWRSPFRPAIGVPYLILYYGTVMFYWWPLARLGRPLWLAYTVLFIIANILNIASH